MTQARPAGSFPARPIILDRSFSRAGVFAGAGTLAAINAQADQILTFAKYNSLVDVAFATAGISVVIWAAIAAALRIGLEDRCESWSKWDAAVLGLSAVLSFIPMAYVAKLALLLCGVYLFFTSRSGGATRRVALILLALAGPLVVGRILLNLFEAPVLGLDAHLVGSVIGSQVDGNTVSFATGGRKFLVASGCSSVHNMSLAVLMWTTAAAVFSVRLDRRYAIVGLAMVVWMFALNIARLASIGLFPDQYEFLHNGAGAALFGWAGLIGAGALTGLGVVRAAERQH